MVADDLAMQGARALAATWSGVDINSSDAEDGMFQLWGSIPYQLMPWLHKSCQSISRHGIGCIGQTTSIVVPELISPT